MSATCGTIVGECAARLHRRYAEIARTRMAGVPICHPRLSVDVVGFEAEDGFACGVLVTPWCMNLVRMPLDAAARACIAPPGITAPRDFGKGRFDFLGSEDAELGCFEAASLFSPMDEFTDQANALAVAAVLLSRLRTAPEPEHVEQPARRRLFGLRTA